MYLSVSHKPVQLVTVSAFSVTLCSKRILWRIIIEARIDTLQKSSNTWRSAKRDATIYTSCRSTTCHWRLTTPITGLSEGEWMRARLTAGMLYHSYLIPALVAGLVAFLIPPDRPSQGCRE